MRRRPLLLTLLALNIVACEPATNDGADGTPDPATGESGAPLRDDAIGPSDRQEEDTPGDDDS